MADDDLRRQVIELSARVASLEAAMRGSHPQVSDSSSAPPPPPLRPMLVAAPVPSLESRIGGQWLNRIGIAAVLIGMAWFLKLAFDRNWIGPGIRIVIGLVCAAGLIAWSERFRRQGFSAFSYTLKALGTSIAYLSLWAASSVFHLVPWWLIFAAMTGVTLANALLARQQDSEVLAVYALAGGLATPGLLSVERGNPWFLFSYLVLLNVGALVLLARRPWKRLAWAALLGTAAYSVGWTTTADHPPHLLTAGFLSVLFAGFAAVPFLLRSDFSSGFPVVNAAATWVGLMSLLGTAARPSVTLALALACLLLARVPAAVALCRTHLGLGVFFMTVAIPLQFHGPAMTLGWLGEGLVLLLVGSCCSRHCDPPLRHRGAGSRSAGPPGRPDTWNPAPCHQPGRSGGICHCDFSQPRQAEGIFQHRFRSHSIAVGLPGDSPLLVLRSRISARLLRLWPTGAPLHHGPIRLQCLLHVLWRGSHDCRFSAPQCLPALAGISAVCFQHRHGLPERSQPSGPGFSGT